MSGEGDFWVQAPGEKRCSGTYNSLDTNPTIVVPVTCSNGARGEIVITRQLNGLSDTAIGKLSDGTTGQFVFGDLKFDRHSALAGRRSLVAECETRAGA